MVGVPPSRRPAIPTDAAEHALDFSHRYAELMNYHVENRMMELGIPTDQIGARKYGTRTGRSGPRRPPASVTSQAAT